MKQFNIIPFLFSAIKDVANAMANTYKRAAEYECAKAKLEIILKKLDSKVIESEHKSNIRRNYFCRLSCKVTSRNSV